MPSPEQLRELVDTVVIVMLENRSFDHMLGHLKYESYNEQVHGLRHPLRSLDYANPSLDGELYFPFVLSEDRYLPADPPHERDQVCGQMELANGTYTMKGFVKEYHGQTIGRTETPEVMGFFSAAHVPVTHFLAMNFLVCDNWFSPLPTSTQPNRLMAFAGDSPVDNTQVRVLRPDNIMFDWLAEHGVRWRVYHDGMVSSFLLFGMFEEFLSPNFRSLDALALDIREEPDDEFPQVIVIEPSYQSVPHLGSDQPNDNHAPLPVGPGEQLLRRIYNALTTNPARWAKTVMILTYDEHGGFFDHQPPLQIRYSPPDGGFRPFETTGPRVPTIIVSPLVRAGSVDHRQMDHTSILQFLAELFEIEEGLSDTVNERKLHGIQSVSKVVNRSTARLRIPIIPNTQITSASAIDRTIRPVVERIPLEHLFQEATIELMDSYPDETRARHPKLWEWRLTQLR